MPISLASVWISISALKLVLKRTRALKVVECMPLFRLLARDIGDDRDHLPDGGDDAAIVSRAGMRKIDTHRFKLLAYAVERAAQ